VSKTITEPAKRKGMNLGALGDFASTSTLTRYVWEYSPELTIELQNTFKFDNGISLGMVYIEEKEYENSVVYTWTKYRDAYQATKNPKIQL
ncbi:MAG: hypothetical protein FWH41_01410, partial [Treponema sp.]|nr:hypothetical protein [Treponema sp.]